MTTVENPTPLLESWHEYFRQPSPERLSAMLADDVVFVSPVVHTPQEGRQKTMAYLWSAAAVFGSGPFEYLNEWTAGDPGGEGSAVLEFRSEIDGIQIHGVDMIWWNAEQRITRFQVMVRPLKAIQLLHGMMARQLQQLAEAQTAASTSAGSPPGS